mmetsp:Transcript_63480/g.149435  ORF Transcript_63480/g.149435 Transcript_63480/m.149435 type:complete len:202 (-) Transcript_63480:810-1415(-)
MHIWSGSDVNVMTCVPLAKVVPGREIPSPGAAKGCSLGPSPVSHEPLTVILKDRERVSSVRGGGSRPLVEEGPGPGLGIEGSFKRPLEGVVGPFSKVTGPDWDRALWFMSALLSPGSGPERDMDWSLTALASRVTLASLYIFRAEAPSSPPLAGGRFSATPLTGREPALLAGSSKLVSRLGGREGSRLPGLETGRLGTGDA